MLVVSIIRLLARADLTYFIIITIITTLSVCLSVISTKLYLKSLSNLRSVVDTQGLLGWEASWKLGRWEGGLGGGGREGGSF